MGQQQLLLIVLGVIIVGVAIVAGIALFNAGSEESTKDEIVAQCMNIGANAQQWFKKPKSMAGGENSFVGYAIPTKMRYTTNCGTATTPGYVPSGWAAKQVTITGNPTNYDWNVVCTVTDTIITTVIQ
ncbi:MAG TPA: hypothetical protein VFF33_04725 [Ignavibacteriaceae bacterium]|nr:hypothetical protein [Ignavibacteriaceae bacterium]